MLDDSISQVIYLVIHIGLFVLPNCVSVCVGRGDSHLNMIFLLPVSALNNVWAACAEYPQIYEKCDKYKVIFGQDLYMSLSM